MKPPRDKAKELMVMADEFESISGWIREYVTGDAESLPMTWDVQEFYERYKNIVREMGVI